MSKMNRASKLVSKIYITMFSRILPTKLYLKILFFIKIGKPLNIKSPTTYNEKIQWIKIYDRNPLYTKISDKYEVREYVKNLIGEQHLTKLYGVWETPDEIDFDLLPNKFVLKVNNDSGGVIICRNKSEANINEIRKNIKKRMRKKFYFPLREWQYKDIKPLIIAEEYLVSDIETNELPDYKFFCFDGKAKFLFIATERQSANETKFDFFDMNFEHINVINGHPNSDRIISKPKNFEKMITLAELLSQNFPHVRVDLYDVNGNIYFGELTLMHYGGMVPFKPYKFDIEFGKDFILPKI